MNIKEAIEHLKEILKLYRAGLSVKYMDEEIEATKTVLAELEKKDKIINLMAEQLTTDIHSKEWVIDYYMNKIPIYIENKIEEDK